MDSTLAQARSLLAALALAGVVLVPAHALAEVKITEIMYDAQGGDTGHEWLEITNLGSEPVAVNKYKLFESGTNHGLVLVTGVAVLASSASAIITTDPSTFAADYPGVFGTVFKAAFSFANTGETVALKNASSTMVDSVTYSSSMGAAGDGASLHRLSTGAWKAGTPDPGIYTGSVNVQTDTKTTTTPQRTGTNTTAAPTPKASAGRHTTPQKTATTSTTTQSAQVAPSVAGMAPTPEQSNLPVVLESVLGLVAIILLGVGSVWYAKGVTENMVEETSPTPEEFDIES